MSYRAELANAARWLKAAVESLPEQHRPDIVLEWRELLEDVEDCRSDGAREVAIIQWRAEMQERLAPALLHAPSKSLAEGTSAGVTGELSTGAPPRPRRRTAAPTSRLPGPARTSSDRRPRE